MTIWIDHRSVGFMLRQEHPSRFVRHRLRLEEFDHDVEYAESSRNKADWLSRFGGGLTVRPQQICLIGTKDSVQERELQWCLQQDELFKEMLTAKNSGRTCFQCTRLRFDVSDFNRTKVFGNNEKRTMSAVSWLRNCWKKFTIRI